MHDNDTQWEVGQTVMLFFDGEDHLSGHHMGKVFATRNPLTLSVLDQCVPRANMRLYAPRHTCICVYPLGAGRVSVLDSSWCAPEITHELSDS